MSAVQTSDWAYEACIVPELEAETVVSTLAAMAAAKTWDGEPMFSSDTVREQRLFNAEAFKQLRGQRAFDNETL